MTLPRNILVPTDFSEGAGAALDYAIALAAKLDAKVHLLNVVGLQVLGTEMGLALRAPMIDEMLRGSQQELDRLLAAHAGQCALGPTHVETGDARAQIEAVARKLEADLIVMGTHGRRGVSRMLLGSVAEAVARIAPCPVLLIRKPGS